MIIQFLVSGISLNNSFVVSVYFQNLKRYLEIKQIRAYTFPNLVGNVGGYMGLFLGYAILNFPRLLIKLFNSMNNMVLKCNIVSDGNYNDGEV